MTERAWETVGAELRRPFTTAAIKMKPQSVTKDLQKGLVSYYIDARLAAERLNAAVGADGWTEEYKVIAPDPRFGLPIECRLTVLGVTRADVGQIAPGEMDEKAWKSAYSDALKRAAVKFGVGAYLYNSPNNWVETKVGNNGKAQGFSDAGARAARDHYTRWLGSSQVTGLYGQPLDHGDVEQTHVEETAVEATAQSGAASTQPLATAAEQKKLDRLIANLTNADGTKDWASIANKYCEREFSHGRDQLTKSELPQVTEALEKYLSTLAEQSTTSELAGMTA